jgi:hypothetical protein
MKVFRHIFIMTGGGPGTATEVTNFYAYLQGFSYTYVGYSSAIIVVMLLATLIMSLGVLRVAGRDFDVEQARGRVGGLRHRAAHPRGPAPRALHRADVGAVWDRGLSHAAHTGVHIIATKKTTLADKMAFTPTPRGPKGHLPTFWRPDQSGSFSHRSSCSATSRIRNPPSDPFGRGVTGLSAAATSSAVKTK